jgi:hypothetical protein
MNEEDYGEKKAYYIVEGQWIPADDTEFLNISEDLFGRDVYEFIYKGKAYTSHCVVK